MNGVSGVGPPGSGNTPPPQPPESDNTNRDTQTSLQFLSGDFASLLMGVAKEAEAMKEGK